MIFVYGGNAVRVTCPVCPAVAMAAEDYGSVDHDDDDDDQ